MWAWWETVSSWWGADCAFGGIYAFKPWYHSTRADNIRHWPGNYSITHWRDLLGPADKAAAVNFTSRSAQRGDYRRMIEVTRRVLDIYDNPNDPRIGPHNLAEFYGTLDGRTVVGRLHGKKAVSDLSHLWHAHAALHRQWADNAYVAGAVASGMIGEPLAAWSAREYPGSVPAIGGGGDVSDPIKPRDVRPTTYREVWNVDAMPAPANSPTAQTNRWWQPETHIVQQTERIRTMQMEQLPQLTAMVSDLAAAMAGLSAASGGADLEQVRQVVRAEQERALTIAAAQRDAERAELAGQLAPVLAQVIGARLGEVRREELVAAADAALRQVLGSIPPAG